MKRCVWAAILLVAAISCRHGRSDAGRPFAPGDSLIVDSVSLEYEDSVYQDFTLSLQFFLSYVDDERLPQEVRDSVNATILTVALGEDNAAVDFREAGENTVRAIVESYEEEARLMAEDEWDFGKDGYWYLSSGFEGDAPEMFRNYVINFNEYHYGAIHGYYSAAGYVFDLTTGKLMTEPDVFVPDYYSPLMKLLTEHLLNDSDEDVLDMLLVDEVEPNGNFTFGEKGITYIYNPYAICAYAAGIVEITLPWEDLSEILRPEVAERVMPAPAE